MVGDLLGGSLVILGVVMLVFRRPIAASADAQRTSWPRSSSMQDRLKQESAHRAVIAGVLLVVGGAALIAAAVSRL